MTFAQWVSGLVSLINSVVIPAIFTLAFLVFVWGMVNLFFLNPEDESKRKRGRDFALWGILGMVLLFGVWGVVQLLLGTLGF